MPVEPDACAVIDAGKVNTDVFLCERGGKIKFIPPPPPAFEWAVFRHVLIEMATATGHGERGVLARPLERKHSRDAVTELASRLNFDASAFVQLMEIRAAKGDRKRLSTADIAQRYLAGIEKVAAAVDTMQSSSVNT